MAPPRVRHDTTVSFAVLLKQPVTLGTSVPTASHVLDHKRRYLMPTSEGMLMLKNPVSENSCWDDDG
jgi:hypothetical protein